MRKSQNAPHLGLYIASSSTTLGNSSAAIREPGLPGTAIRAPSASAEGTRQLGNCRDHRTGTRNRHRSIAARDIEDIAPHVDQHQCRRTHLLAGCRPVTRSN
jgi:hypothetical protein